MKNKKTIWSVILLFSMSLFVSSSCSKDENKKPAAPTIELVHVGTHDSSEDNVFYLGEPAHFEANINAPGLVQKIEVEIRQKSGYGNFSLKTEYKSDYVGKKEVLAFHDHPVIPEGEAIGDYSFQIKVTDQQGQVGTADANITVKVGEGSEHEHEHEHEHD